MTRSRLGGEGWEESALGRYNVFAGHGVMSIMDTWTGSGAQLLKLYIDMHEWIQLCDGLHSDGSEATIALPYYKLIDSISSSIHRRPLLPVIVTWNGRYTAKSQTFTCSACCGKAANGSTRASV